VASVFFYTVAHWLMDYCLDVLKNDEVEGKGVGVVLPV
jgi:hypothetical protein